MRIVVSTVLACARAGWFFRMVCAWPRPWDWELCSDPPGQLNDHFILIFRYVFPFTPQQLHLVPRCFLTDYLESHICKLLIVTVQWTAFHRLSLGKHLLTGAGTSSSHSAIKKTQLRQRFESESLTKSFYHFVVPCYTPRVPFLLYWNSHMW